MVPAPRLADGVAVEFHAGDFQVHLHLGEFAMASDTEFFQFELFHLLLVQFLLVFRFGTLQVEFEDRCSYIDGVAAFFVYLDDTGVDGGIDDLFKSGYHLAGGADRYFDDALVDGGYSQVFTVQAGLQERNDHGNDGYGRLPRSL